MTKPQHWPFEVPRESVAVTTRAVTTKALPVREVFHEEDEEGVGSWQFHTGNGDFSAENLMLATLEEMVVLDPTLVEVARLPVGSTATRESVGGVWTVRSLTE